MKITESSFWPDFSSPWIAEDSQPELVSVIVPTFNRQAYLADAIESVFQQSYRPIELIIIDDGSTDNTNELVQAWMAEHQNLEGFYLHYHKQQNKGVSAARNAGLLLSHGQYIQFLDSDDLLLPERVSKCVAAAETSGADFVYSAHYLDYSGDSSENKGRGLVLSAVSDMGDVPDPRYYIWTVAVFFMREIISLAGPWNESLRICEDAEYFSRVFALARRASPITEPLVVKRKHGGARLLDVQHEYDGLDSRYRCLEIRQRIIRSCGYPDEDFTGGWLQLAQDSLGIGFLDIAEKCLAVSQQEGLRSIRFSVWWYILKFSCMLPRSFGMKFFPLANSVRNNVKWLRDTHVGKIKKIETKPKQDGISS